MSKMRKRGVIIFYILVFWVALPAALIGGAILLDQKWDFERLQSETVLITGAFIICLSAPLLIVSILQFRKFGKELPISATPPELIIRKGLFAIWRHPIYLFYSLLFLGITIILGLRSGLYFVMPLFYLVVGLYIYIEEKILIKRFGAPYRNHLKQTPLLIPTLINFFKVPLWILEKYFFSVRFTGKENIPASPPFFLVCSHRNYLDPFIIGLPVPFRINYVTTYEMFRKPLLGFVFRKLACIPKKRYLNDLQTAREIIKNIKEDQVVGIFPEGERSWTGSMNSFKTETLNLFRKFHHVPILPVQLDGNYYAWPRWGSWLRKSLIVVHYKPLLHINPNTTSCELEQKLQSLLQPKDNPDEGYKCGAKNRAKNLPMLLYRCPVCFSFDSIDVTGKSDLRCFQCNATFSLDEQYNITYTNKGGERKETIEELYKRIKIVKSDIANRKSDSPETQIANSGEVWLYQEVSDKFNPVALGRIILTMDSFIFSSQSELVIALNKIGAITVESNCKLQLFNRSNHQLYQVVFENESAKKWQDYITLMMHENRFPKPITR